MKSGHSRGTTPGRVEKWVLSRLMSQIEVPSSLLEVPSIQTAKPHCNELFDYFNDLAHAGVQILDVFEPCCSASLGALSMGRLTVAQRAK